MTLRRELIQRFVKIIAEQALIVREDGDKPDWHNEQAEELAEMFADSALELRGFQFPKFDLEKAGIDWQIYAGVDIAQSQIDKDKLEKSAIDAFESAFGIKGNWNWYPAKPQEERVWKAFREYLMELYSADKDCFTKYFTWAHQPYSRGVMTGRQIKNNPQDFPDAWAAFCASAMYGYTKPRKIVPDSERTDLDDDGIPQSYM